MATNPTFASGYVEPGTYVLQRDVSPPNVPGGTRIQAIIGQGSKALERLETLTKGVVNGQDGPLSSSNTVDIQAITDENNVVYTKDADFQVARSGSDVSVDWSLTAQISGTEDISGLTNTTTVLNAKFDGGSTTARDNSIEITSAGTAADIVSQINAWVRQYLSYDVASLNADNNLVLNANSIVIEGGAANSLFGLTTGDFAEVQEPATGITYQVTYTSLKTSDELKPQIFGNQDDVIDYCGEQKTQTIEYTGTATGVGDDTITDSSQAFTVNALIGKYVKLTSGDGTGQVRIVKSNTATEITLMSDWSAGYVPAVGSEFQVTDINENSLTLGSKVAFDGGATFVIVSQYSDDIFDTNNIKLAIDNLEQDVGGFAPEMLVLMRGLGAAETGPITYLEKHCVTMSNVLNNKFRVCAVGMAQGVTDFTVYRSLALAIKERRVTIVDIPQVAKNFGSGVVQLDGSYVAAGYGGLYCAPVDAGEPLTRKTLTTVFEADSFVDPFTVKEKNEMASAGITVLEKQGVDIVVRHALTTDNTTDFTHEAKLTRSADAISNGVRNTLDAAFTGKRFTSSSVGDSSVVAQAKAVFTLHLNTYTNPLAQIATKIEDITVEQNSTNKRQLDFKAKIYLTPDIVWQFILLNYTI